MSRCGCWATSWPRRATGRCASTIPAPATSAAEGDVEPAEGHWRAWQKSIDGAADWLRATTGASELVLCGLRIGAMLATLVAAERHDVAGVIQIAPVVRGNSYVRQLLVQAQLQTGQPLPPDQDLIFYEFRLSPRTLDEMRAVDLRKLKLVGGQRVAIYPRAASKRWSTTAPRRGPPRAYRSHAANGPSSNR